MVDDLGCPLARVAERPSLGAKRASGRVAMPKLQLKDGIHVDTWSEYAFVILLDLVFLAALLIAIWKAIKRRFSPYWTLALALLVLGPAVFLSPWYSDIRVR